MGQQWLQRHDGTKPGFNRERKCTLNDMEFQKAFEALCFVTKEKGQSFKGIELYTFAEKAIATTNIKADPQKLIYDINKITCLILTEGKEYRFIHKCVQDYFSASFIKYKPDKVAINFYSRLVNDGYKWSDELLFLEEIDKHRFLKHYFIPLCRKILNISGTKVMKRPKIRSITNLIKYTDLYHFSTDDRFYYGFSGPLRPLVNTSKLRADSRNVLFKKLFMNKILKQRGESILEISTESAIRSPVKIVSIADIYNKKICTDVIESYANELFDVIHQAAFEVQQYLKEEEKIDFLTGIVD